MLNGNKWRKLKIFWEREKSNEVLDYYPTVSAQETKQTNKQNSLPTLTVSCELFKQKQNE